MLSVSGATSESVREFSGNVFNNRYALEVMALIGRWDDPKPRFYARQLARRLNVDSNDVRPVLDRLVGAGLILQLSERGPYGAIYFQRVDAEATFWEFVVRLFEERKQR